MALASAVHARDIVECCARGLMARQISRCSAGWVGRWSVTRPPPVADDDSIIARELGPRYSGRIRMARAAYKYATQT